MDKKYLPSEFEKKWSNKWIDDKTYQTKQGKNKIYALSMFPYPSGSGLHIGHVRIYTGTDVLARYFRMKGYSVLHPMGWDAFGLPAENAAVKEKKNPMDMVPLNIANFKRQMQSLGFSYDWDREFSTTDPEYYRITQWLFIQFFKMGLLYKKNTPINYCPKCKTGLAEEEVLNDGTHERCGSMITKKELPQWLFRITAYADRLLKDLEGLDWPKGILEMQRNWIGRSEGVELEFKVQNSEFRIKVFTTALDTIFGASFMVISPEHDFVTELLNSNLKCQMSKLDEIKNYVEKAKTKSEIERNTENKDKSGVFTGLFCINPFNNKLVPIWIADYVLMSYGTGAVMGVPGHDSRDHEFAKKFKLPVIPVIKPKNVNIKLENDGFWNYEEIKTKYFDESILFNSGEYSGLSSKVAKEKMNLFLEKNGMGERKINYHLRDWIFSRQRYWGEPIPMIYCARCAIDQVKSEQLKVKSYNTEFKIDREVIEANLGWFPLPDEELPLKLPYVKSYEPTDTGESPLSQIDSFVKTKCPNCGGEARRETDTMPNWAGSCWYFIAFSFWNQENQNSKSEYRNSKQTQNLNNQNSLKNSNFENLDLFRDSSFDIRNFNNPWLPVDWYLGGAEHAVLHLLYARFWVKVLYDLKLIDFKEPFLRLRNVGMVLAEDHRKMSKSIGNVINPDDVIKEYGADTLRMYEMFMAPFNQEIAWSTTALQGAYRFLKRVWSIYDKLKVKNEELKVKIEKIKIIEDSQLVTKLNKTIKKVTEDIQQIKYNTSIASMMEFLNAWEARTSEVEEERSDGKTSEVNNGLSIDNAKKFLQILAPFAPYITEEIWYSVFGETQSIHLSTWPSVDDKSIIDTEIQLPVQINGKTRAVLHISSSDSSQDTVVKKALTNEKVQKYLEGKKHRVIYIQNKILNFVLT